MVVDREPTLLAFSSPGVCKAIGTMVLQERTGLYEVCTHNYARMSRPLMVFCSHRKKREAKIKRDVKRGMREPNEQNPFEIFVTVTDIRYTWVLTEITAESRLISAQVL